MKRILSMILCVLMAVSVLSVVCFASAPDFSTSYNGEVIKKSALLVTDKAYGKADGDIIIQEWDGTEYSFTVGVNAFQTFGLAVGYANVQGIETPDIIVADWDANDGLLINRPMNVYAPNYNTSPFNEDKTRNAAKGDGSDWTENPVYMQNQLTVRDIVITGTAARGNIRIAGFTFTNSINDSYRYKDTEPTNIVFENMMKDGTGNSTYIIICDNANTKTSNNQQCDNVTFNNFYIKNAKNQQLISSNLYAYTTFNGLWVDAKTSGIGAYTNVLRQGADDAEFVIRNSNLRNFRRTDLSNNQYGLFSFEGRNREDVSEGMYSAIVFDNNILHGYIGKTGGDGTAHIIGWYANSYTDFMFCNNYYDLVSNEIAMKFEYLDTTRFFHTTVETGADCQLLDCYGLATIVDNTFNGCRLKFEITNNNVVVPYTLNVYGNFMVEDRSDNVNYAVGGVPEVHVLHKRTDYAVTYLDFARTLKSDTVHPYTLADEAAVDEERKVIYYNVDASTGVVNTIPSVYGMGYDYQINLAGLIQENKYGNKFVCVSTDFGSHSTYEYDIETEEVGIFDREQYAKEFELFMDLRSPDSTVSERWIIKLNVSGYNIDSCKLFTDVKHGAWYERYVNSAYSYNIMLGTNAGDTFEPNTTLSRAMTVTMIARLAGVDTSALKNQNTKFSDVPAGKWYTGAVAWAVNAGVTSGTSATTFNPNADVTREDTCVFLVRYAQYAGITLKDTGADGVFPDDAKIGSWAKTAVYECRKAGIVSGTSEGTFEPKGNTTRSAAAKMFSVFYEDYVK